MYSLSGPYGQNGRSGPQLATMPENAATMPQMDRILASEAS